MNSISIYIYESKDPDLVGLTKQIGMRNFRKLVKLALLALNNPDYIGKSKECMTPGDDLPADTRKFRIIISMRDQQYDELKVILSQLKEKQLNHFVKQVVRFYVSPMDLLPFYFKEDVKFTQQMYKPLVINSVLTSAKRTRAKRENPEPTSPVMPPMYPYGMPPAYYPPYPYPPMPQPKAGPIEMEQKPDEDVKPTENIEQVETPQQQDEPFLDFSSKEPTPETPDDKQDEVLAMLSNLLG